jgi:hypothetical protein
VEPHVGVSGRLLDDASGRPVEGASVDLVWTGGVQLKRDSVRTTTDANGLFEFDVVANEIGDALVDFVVRPPSKPGYRVFGVTIAATVRGGEARVLAPWSNVPHLPDFGEAYRRGGARENIPNVDVEFRPTGGVAVAGLIGGVYRTRTNANGLFPLFGDQLKPLDVGDVIGDLTILLPDPPGPTVHRDYRVKATPEYRYAPRIHRVGAGPNLDYRLKVTNRQTGANVSGVRLDFVRTGGVPLDADTWTLTTDDQGNAHVPSRALQHGFMVGDLTITPPPPLPSYTRTGWQLPTFDTDSTPLGETFTVGPGASLSASRRSP